MSNMLPASRGGRLIVNGEEAEALADLRDVVTDMVGECSRYVQTGRDSVIVLRGMTHASVNTYSHTEVAQLLAMAVWMLAEHRPAGAGGGQDA